ncbi:hypothetical protein CP04DC42_0484 [Chlamydia psittaci 04DC42]|uniref:Uncharacterized protein n=1 Tax=Chlamydia psittaci 99DC5 TaxID=1112251 RepID=A0ABN0MPC2_CHLPS|nr:hypothetical protein G5O_0082 [Chlamydia psittaci 6BC]AFS21487.1 hypothetical protein B599_0080 [Chlamydia psittaci MN]AFS25691.1 hypothetical protein B603_0080 [Chlamydia psittaci WC]AGE74642.1 hypothetical protein AO9_00350 [Chlamydia psittaci Mat116]ATQ71092.1 uncharacterized protein CHPS25_0072 [Chlamydia psittaci]EPJ13497.1 hypothetical protein CP02DC15_0856 [Chlamydia psittaci 02DC15]EPJ14090.1 hypothetical protein CP02DC16_0484 [Chlamydia psittaci 02DC16]EPJ15893.1 hypothetical pro
MPLEICQIATKYAEDLTDHSKFLVALMQELPVLESEHVVLLSLLLDLSKSTKKMILDPRF